MKNYSPNKVYDRLWKDKNNLSTEREKKRWTQAELAEKLQAGTQTVSNWECGRSVPSFDTMIKLADLFDCDLDYLTGRLAEPTHDIAFIHAETGLSTDAIKKLQNIKPDIIKMVMISKLIEHKDLEYLLNRIYQLKFGHKDEVSRYLKTLAELMKDETQRGYLKYTMVEDYLPIIDEVLKIDDENSIDSFIRYQITDKFLSIIDDIHQGKVGGPYK